MRKKSLLVFLMIPILLAAGCTMKKTWHESTFLCFDTVCEVKLSCSASEFRDAEKEVNRVFSEIEAAFSPGSKDLSSPLVVNLFRKARQVFYDSGGAFDISVGPLTKLWGFRDGPHRVPSPQEDSATLNFVGLDKVTEENGRIYLPEKMEFDWGGIGKGLGIDLAYQALAGRGIHNGFVNAGGDLYCWGTNPERAPWKVGIKHPRRNGFLGVLNLSNVGAATSGDYQRYFEIDGVRYHHILDPKTGYPARGKQSVTVIGPETTICDALSTAIFVSSKPEAILDKYPEYGTVIVDEDGKILTLGKKNRIAWVQ